MNHHRHAVAPYSQAAVQLRVDGLSFSYGAHRVLTDITFAVSTGDRAAIIGENGTGKSTLLKVIAGHLEPTAGTVSITGTRTAINGAHNHVPSIGLLYQEPPFKASDTINDAIETAVRHIRQAQDDVTKLGDALAENPNSQQIINSYDLALARAELLDAWDIDVRIATMFAGLGLNRIDPRRRTGTLSGGQRARLALAWLLLRAPEVLLLDEPTNHLDDDATAYLTGLIESWRGPVVIASHDRAFLDEAVTTLLDLDPAALPHAVTGDLVLDGGGTGIGVTRYTGNYTDYLAARRQALSRWRQQYRDEQAELGRLRANVKTQQHVGHLNWQLRSETRMAKKFYADRNAKVVSRRVNDVRTRLAELEAAQIRKPPAPLDFQGLDAAGNPRPANPDQTVLAALEASVAGRLDETTVIIKHTDKWLITGPNGSGKSTLLNLLAGNITPTSGQVIRSDEHDIALLAQDALADLPQADQQLRARELYAKLVGHERAERVPLRTYGLLAGRDHDRAVSELSVGQRRRLALAAILARPAQVLLLDEPTNHFSLNLVTALEEAIETYPGAVVVASHDRWLRQRWKFEHRQLRAV